MPKKGSRKAKPSREFLQQLYITQKLSANSIGEIIGVSKPTVLRYLREYDIDLRGPGGMETSDSWPPSRDTLHELYIVQGISAGKIAPMFNKSPSAILHWLHVLKIPVRNEFARKITQQGWPLSRNELHNLYSVEEISAEKIAALYGTTPSTVLRHLRHYKIEVRPSYQVHVPPSWPPSKEDLVVMYWEDSMTLEQIGTTFGIRPQTVLYHMRRMDIPRRPNTTAISGLRDSDGRKVYWRRQRNGTTQCSQCKFFTTLPINEDGTCPRCNPDGARQCMVCGQFFMPSNPQSHNEQGKKQSRPSVCLECDAMLRPAKITVQCEHCGLEFKTRKGTRFCSSWCCSQARFGHLPEERICALPSCDNLWQAVTQAIYCKLHRRGGRLFAETMDWLLQNSTRNQRRALVSLNTWDENSDGIVAPTMRQWDSMELGPQAHTTLVAFGSWSAFLKKAGYESLSRSFHTRRTDIELAIDRELDALHIDYEPNYYCAPYWIDHAILSHKVAIECDEEYWHSSTYAMVRDREKDLFLAEHGWRVVRILGTAIRTNPTMTVRKFVLPLLKIDPDEQSVQLRLIGC